MTPDGGVIAVYLTGIGALLTVAVALSKTLQDLLGPLGRLVAKRRQDATAKSVERLAAAAIVSGYAPDTARLDQLCEDIAYWRARAERLELRATRLESEIDAVRDEYGARLTELRRQIDELLLRRPASTSRYLGPDVPAVPSAIVSDEPTP